MTDRLVIAIAQLNPVVGDIAGNVARVRAARAEAARGGADLVIFSELVLSGYPPEDLVLKAAFQQRLHEAVHDLRRDTEDGGPALFVGTPWREDDKLHNAILALDMLSAAKKAVGPARELRCAIDPKTGDIRAFAKLVVSEKVSSKHDQISLFDARRIKPDAQFGEEADDFCSGLPRGGDDAEESGPQDKTRDQFPQDRRHSQPFSDFPKQLGRDKDRRDNQEQCGHRVVHNASSAFGV